MPTCQNSALVKMGAVAALIAAVCLSAPRAWAQCTQSSPVSTWVIGGSGDWANGSAWTPSGIPGSSAINVCITDGTSAVTLNTSTSAADLQLASGNALTLGPNTQLTLYGSNLINAGSISLRAGGGTSTSLNIANSVTLSGGGSVALSTAAGGGLATIDIVRGGNSLTNVDNTIEGEGLIYNAGNTIINESTGQILANSNGSTGDNTLVITFGNITNQGLLGATGAGILQLESAAINNAGGHIAANGGTVYLMNYVDVAGGSLATTNGGWMGTPSGYTATLNGSRSPVTILGTYTVSPNSTTNLTGSIVNNGDIVVNGSLAARSAIISGGMLQGTGTVSGSISMVDGTIKGGDSPGVLTINGSYSQSSTSTLLADLAGTTPGTGYSQVVVKGTATVGGTLDVDETSGFEASAGDDFTLLSWTSSGSSVAFSNLNFSDAPLPVGDSWQVVYNPNNVELEVEGAVVTSEPSAWVLLTLGLLAFALYRKLNGTNVRQ